MICLIQIILGDFNLPNLIGNIIQLLWVSWLANEVY